MKRKLYCLIFLDVAFLFHIAPPTEALYYMLKRDWNPHQKGDGQRPNWTPEEWSQFRPKKSRGKKRRVNNWFRRRKGWAELPEEDEETRVSLRSPYNCIVCFTRDSKIFEYVFKSVIIDLSQEES